MQRSASLAMRASAPIKHSSVERLRIDNGGDGLSRLVRDKLLESVRDMRLRDVDVVTLSHTWRAVSHEPSQRESIHPALSATSAERVTPAIEGKRREPRLLHRALMRVLNCHEVTFVSRSWEDVLVFRLAVLRLRSAKQNVSPSGRQWNRPHSVRCFPLRDS